MYVHWFYVNIASVQNLYGSVWSAIMVISISTNDWSLRYATPLCWSKYDSDLPLDSTVLNNLLNSLKENYSPPLDRRILIVHPDWVSTIALNLINIKTVLDLFLRKYTQSKYNIPRTIGNISFHQVRYFALDRKHLCDQSQVFFFLGLRFFWKSFSCFLSKFTWSTCFLVDLELWQTIYQFLVLHLLRPWIPHISKFSMPYLHCFLLAIIDVS